MLEQLAATNPSTQDRQSIDLYRAFCLIALERVEEASEAIAAMAARDPLYRPADSAVSPRLRLMFRDTRRVVLPAIIQSRYERAKAAFDASDYTAAADGFTVVLQALADPDIARESKQPPLADLRVLATGFKDLAVQAMIPSPVPVAAPVPPPAPVAAAPRVDAPRLPRIFDSNDLDVVPPVTVKQDIPPYRRAVLVERIGVLFIVIDERGGVESAIITTPFDGTFDTILLAAAKAWSYQPAARSGVAVKYRKRIQLTLPRQTH